MVAAEVVGLPRLRSNPSMATVKRHPTTRGTTHRWVSLAVLCVSLLLVSLDSMILNVALPDILRATHASTTQLQWFVDAYVVVFAGLLLVWGSLGDRIGRKWVFMAGLAVFGVGSALSAFSATPDRLIGSRAFMGVGAAAIMPSTLSILTDVFSSDEDRSRAIGIWSGTSGLGVALGPMAGGLLLSHYWWGSVFLVNVPIAVAGLVATAWFIPNSRNPTSKAADPVGSVLSVAGIGLLLWGIIEAPNRGWASTLNLLVLAGAVVLLTAFVIWERRCKHPVLELTFFRSARFSSGIGAMATTMFALMGMLFLLTQYFQFSLGYTALQTGVRVAPVAAVLLVVAPLSSLVVRRVGTKPVVFTGMGLVAIGLELLSHVSVAGTYADALPALFLIGVGAGLAFAPSTDSVMGSLPPEQAGVGAATNGTAIQVGGALGVAVLGSLLNTRYQDHLLPVLAHRAIPPPIVHLITGSLGGALGVAQSLGGEVGAMLSGVARQAFVSGMDLALGVGAGVVAAAAVAVAGVLPNRPGSSRPESGKAPEVEGRTPASGGGPGSAGLS
jgi:EmrB/QacA subfamily drug resistance transporter